MKFFFDFLAQNQTKRSDNFLIRVGRKVFQKVSKITLGRGFFIRFETLSTRWRNAKDLTEKFFPMPSRVVNVSASFLKGDSASEHCLQSLLCIRLKTS